LAYRHLRLNPFVSQVGFFRGFDQYGQVKDIERLNPFVSQVGFFSKASRISRSSAACARLNPFVSQVGFFHMDRDLSCRRRTSLNPFVSQVGFFHSIAAYHRAGKR